MNDDFEAGGAYRRRATDRAVLIVVAMAFAAIALNDTVPGLSTHAGVHRHRMKPFVLLFRQGPAPLTEADLKARADAIVTWTERQNDAGHALDPRTLGDQSQWIGPDDLQGIGTDHPNAGTEARSVSSFLLLEARNFGEAVAIARSHPALLYGSSVEVRAAD